MNFKGQRNLKGRRSKNNGNNKYQPKHGTKHRGRRN